MDDDDNGSLIRAEQRMRDVARFFERLSFMAVAGHTDAVTHLCFSPDGRYLVSAAFDGTVKIWEATSYRLLHNLEHGGWVNSVVFSDSGAKFASGFGSTAIIWDTASGRELQRLEHRGHVNSVAFRSGGVELASGSDNGTVVIWDSTSGIELKRLEHQGRISSVVFSLEGATIASGSSDRTVKIWDPKSGRLLATFLSVGRSGWITYTRDGHFIGSDEAVKRVMMKWEHGGNQYPASIFPRDNPNPQKVAEALAAGRSRKPPPPRTPPRRPAGLSGKRQPLLPGGSKK